MSADASARFDRSVADGDIAAVTAALDDDRDLVAARIADGDGTGVDHTALHTAARHGRVEVAAILLDAGAEIDAATADPEGPRTALHDAYEHGQLDMTEFLIDRGADYDINVAAARGDFDRVKELVIAEPAVVNDASTGLSPLGWAGYGQDARMVPFLLVHGAELTDEICCPCGTGNVAILHAFLDAGADPDELFPTWRARPLHVAAAMPHTTDNTAAVELLLEAGADPDGLAADGVTTPLLLAERMLDECDEADQARADGLRAVIGLLEARLRAGDKT